MLESDLNLLASHQDQLHRERQRKMQASSDIQYIYIFFDKISMVSLECAGAIDLAPADEADSSFCDTH